MHEIGAGELVRRLGKDRVEPFGAQRGDERARFIGVRGRVQQTVRTAEDHRDAAGGAARGAVRQVGDGARRRLGRALDGEPAPRGAFGGIERDADVERQRVDDVDDVRAVRDGGIQCGIEPQHARCIARIAVRSDDRDVGMRGGCERRVAVPRERGGVTARRCDGGGTGGAQHRPAADGVGRVDAHGAPAREAPRVAIRRQARQRVAQRRGAEAAGSASRGEARFVGERDDVLLDALAAQHEPFEMRQDARRERARERVVARRSVRKDQRLAVALDDRRGIGEHQRDDGDAVVVGEAEVERERGPALPQHGLDAHRGEPRGIEHGARGAPRREDLVRAVRSHRSAGSSRSRSAAAGTAVNPVSASRSWPAATTTRTPSSSDVRHAARSAARSTRTATLSSIGLPLAASAGPDARDGIGRRDVAVEQNVHPHRRGRVERMRSGGEKTRGTLELRRVRDGDGDRMRRRRPARRR